MDTQFMRRPYARVEFFKSDENLVFRSPHTAHEFFKIWQDLKEEDH